MHELLVSDVRFHFLACPFSRDAKSGDATADGVLTIDRRKCYLEIDHSGNMSRKQMEKKWQRYGIVEGFILVVCMTDARMGRMRQWAERVKDVVFFTTHKRLFDGQPWIDFSGETQEIGTPVQAGKGGSETTPL